MKTRFFGVLMAGCGLLFTSPVLAHHFFPQASDKTVPIAGKVTKFEWVNPHSRLFIDVKDKTGKVNNWEIELGSPAALTKRGWKIDSLKFGDPITVEAILWKGRVNAAVAQDVQFPDGRKVFAGSHAGDPPLPAGR
jgi:hypothetical protein